MHVFFITRGIKKDVDDFITQLQGQYFPIKMKSKDGAEIDAIVQANLKPIQLWDLAIPEGELDTVLATLFGEPNTQLTKSQKNLKKGMWAIRKGIGAEPIPNYKTNKKLPCRPNNTMMLPIGIKKDGITKAILDGKEYETEGI